MSIHRLKNGIYRVKWRVNGQQRSRNFKRKPDAIQFEAKLSRMEQVAEGDSQRVNFREFSEEWIERYARVRKAAGSVLENEAVIRKYFLPAWGTKSIQDITIRDIEYLRADISRQGKKPKTLNNIFRLLHRMFVLAERWGYLSKNPCTQMESLKVHQAEMKFWSFPELDRFLSYAKAHDEFLYDVVAFAVNTGLRYGEIKGMLRDCVDLERNEILVTRSYCSRTNQLVERTKRMRARRVPINSVVREIVQRRSLIPMSAPIFPGFDRKNFVSRKFEKAMVAAQVTRIRFHDLRHTFGSHLAMLGVPVIKIKELMGHSDIKVTMGYMHLAPNDLDGCTEVLIRSAKTITQSEGHFENEKNVPQNVPFSKLGVIDCR